VKFLHWLYPGLGVKQWFAFLLSGIFLFLAGLAVTIGPEIMGLVEAFFMREILVLAVPFFPSLAVGLLVMLLGAILAVYSFHRLTAAISKVFDPGGRVGPAWSLYRHRALERGPRIVAVGGGTGLPVLLRGVKEYTSNITAIVTVADDGGSSGRLRSEMGVLPPGDIRNCLVALADAEPLMQSLFQHRFGGRSGLAGHNFGNLFIAAMSEVTGDFEAAVRESSKVLAVRGRVLPSTLDDVQIVAQLEDGTLVRGETCVSRSPGAVRKICLDPPGARPLPEALGAIEEADLIVLAPGSLFTSLLPTLLIPGMAEAIHHSTALKIYVCNIMTQPGETDGFTVADHVRAILEHVGQNLLDYVLVNTGKIPPWQKEKYAREGARLVEVDRERVEAAGVRLVTGNLVAAPGRADMVRHDHEKLAQAVVSLLAASRK